MSIDLKGLIALLLFIAPGFLYLRAYLAARPRYQRAPDLFQQTVLAVVGSTLIHSILVGIIAIGILAYAVWTGRDPIVREFFPIPTTAAEARVSVVAIYSLVATIYIAVSLILARRAGAWLGRLLPERTPKWYRILAGNVPTEQVLLWYTTLVEEPLRRGATRPRLVVWLRSGERFEGILAELRLSADEVNVIELALDEVLFQPSALARSVQATSPISSKPTSLLHHRILLRSGDILWLGRIDNIESSETARQNDKNLN
jgi:hypothetical protein